MSEVITNGIMSHEVIAEVYEQLSALDWQAALGFDARAYGVDVGNGAVDGVRVGVMRAIPIALSRRAIGCVIEGVVS